MNTAATFTLYIPDRLFQLVNGYDFQSWRKQRNCRFVTNYHPGQTDGRTVWQIGVTVEPAASEWRIDHLWGKVCATREVRETDCDELWSCAECHSGDAERVVVPLELDGGFLMHNVPINGFCRECFQRLSVHDA